MSIYEKIKSEGVTGLLWQTYSEFGRDNSNLLAAAVAYSLLFSIFPFALALLSVAGYLMASEEVENQVITAMGNLIPVARNMIVNTLEGVIRAREATGIVAFIMLVWSALTFFDALRNALNRAWGVPEGQTYVKGKLLNISMLVLAVLGMVAFTWLTTTLHYMHESGMQIWIFKFTRTGLFFRLTFAMFSAALAYGTILILYHFIPATRPGWRHIWLGALLATAGFEIIRYFFVWYVKNFAQYGLIYGPISSVVVLLMFIYLTAWVLLFFAKFSCVKMRREAGGPQAV
jgi:membrane protein